MKQYDGKTVNDILTALAAEKGCAVENIIYYVLEEKEGGLFGIGKSAKIEAFTMDDVNAFIESYLNQYFDDIDVKHFVEVKRGEDDSFYVTLDAENNSVLIGKNGQTLQAINTVVRAATNAQFKRRFSIIVDVNGYKEERYEKIKVMAERIAKTVAKTHVSARLGPMPNDERKVIHQYLNGMANIRTESEGEGADRRLKIIYDDGKPTAPNRKPHVRRPDHPETAKAPEQQGADKA